MENTTATDMIEAMKNMTTDERMAYLMAQRPDVFQVKAPVLSLEKAPKGGWTDADRIAK